MVTLGVAGVLAMALPTLVKEILKGRENFSLATEELQVNQIISTILLDKDACTQTFSGAYIGSPITQIKNKKGGVVYESGTIYGDHVIKIDSFTTVDKNEALSNGTRNINLIVKYEKIKKIASKKTNDLVIALNVVAPGPTGLISQCQADDQPLLVNICHSLSGTDAGGLCQLNQFVLSAGDTMTGQLNLPNLISAGAITSPVFCTAGNCKSVNDIALANKSCPGDSLQFGVLANGLPNCKSTICPLNHYFVGVDSSGNKICQKAPLGSCGANQYVSSIAGTGDLTCANLPIKSDVICGVGKYLEAIDANGIPTCKNVMSFSNMDCGVGNYLQGFDSARNKICKTK